MIKSIIVPTDFSSCAQNAADYAALLAMEADAQLLIFHSAYVRFSEGAMLVDYSDQIRSISEEYLSEELSRLKSKFPQLGSKVSTRLVLGTLDEELNHLVKKEAHDLIVMGTKGRSAWEELLLGSETARVIDSAKVPVLAVPPSFEFGDASKIVFASSLEEKLSEQDEHLIRLFMGEDAEIHVYPPYEDYLDMDPEKEQQLLNEFHHHFKQYIDLDLSFNSNHVDSIEGYAESLNADFLVVRKTHQPFLKELFRVSVSKGLSYRAKMPLLVLR